MIKVLAVCGNGMGTSLVIKMKVKQFLDEQGINASMESCSLGEAGGYMNQGVNIVLCSKNLVSNLHAPEGVHVIGLVNLMSAKEFGPQIMNVVNEHFPGEMGK